MTQPDIALINLNAPGLDGLGVIHWLTRQQPQVTLLALCDPAGEDQLRAALKAGASGYLPHEARPIGPWPARLSTLLKENAGHPPAHILRRSQP